MSPPSDHHPHHHPPLSWGWSQVARSRQTAITCLCRLPLAPILRPAFSKYPRSVKRESVVGLSGVLSFAVNANGGSSAPTGYPSTLCFYGQETRGAGYGPEGEERKTKEANRGQVTGAHLEEHPPGLLGTHGAPRDGPERQDLMPEQDKKTRGRGQR